MTYSFRAPTRRPRHDQDGRRSRDRKIDAFTRGMGMKDKFLSDPFSDFDEFPWYSSISPPESLPVLRELVRTLGGPGMCQFHNQASDRSFGRSSRKKVITMSLRTRFWLAAFGGLFVVSSAEAGLQLIEPRTSRPQRAMSSMAPRSMDSMGLTLTNPPPTPPLLRPTLPKPSHVAPERPANFNRPETPGISRRETEC
jgi:hypothetical protein